MDFFLRAYWRLENTVIIVLNRGLENKNVPLFYLVIRKSVNTLKASLKIVNVRELSCKIRRHH